MKKLVVLPYEDRYSQDWDRFIDSSRNGTFILKRNYMEYHKDRFPDSSFIAFEGDELVALIPGTINGTRFFSHSGLTYGGWITNERIGQLEMLELFSKLNSLLSNANITTVIYKPVPHLYHRIPSEEDLYALFILNATLAERKVSSAIILNKKTIFSYPRERGIRKAKKNNLRIEKFNDYDAFWQVLELNLQNRHSVRPVHSVSEIQYLANLFPNNILLYLAMSSYSEVLGGTVLYIDHDIVHVQYISSNEKGRAVGALDLLFDFLVNDAYRDYRIFDFGTSCLEGGKVLDEGLIFQKEGFGGRAICYDTYAYKL